MHFYTHSGEACHWVPKAKGGGTRPTTTADAKKLNLIPSVTTVLNILDKPALVEWRIRQAVMAVLTSPKQHEEDLDAFVRRVLDEEGQQDQEAQKAKDLGTNIHQALEDALNGRQTDDALQPYIRGPLERLKAAGAVLHTEQILVGEGYAGKTDAIMRSIEGGFDTLVDLKTTKKLPTKGSWTEHKLQLSAYAAAWKPWMTFDIRTANLYISTTDPGQFVWFDNDPWKETFHRGFVPILRYWQWVNGFMPTYADPTWVTDS